MNIWHKDAALKGRFHPQYPDDLQVLVHEGSFRFTETSPEVMWARVFGLFEITTNEGRTAQAYKAILLNQSNQLKTLKIEQEILFVAHSNYKYPIRVTQDYLVERASYVIEPCMQCGLPETFDPITKLLEHSFPDLKRMLDSDKRLQPSFTSFCPLCGGTMLVRHKELTELKANKRGEENQNPLSRFKGWFGKK